MECERERRTVEDIKTRLHEQLLSKMARRKASEIFEMERKRKIEEMKRLTDTVSAEGIAMAETNARLSQVHVDLKNAFQKMRVRKKYFFKYAFVCFPIVNSPSSSSSSLLYFNIASLPVQMTCMTLACIFQLPQLKSYG